MFDDMVEASKANLISSLLEIATYELNRGNRKDMERNLCLNDLIDVPLLD
jgi:hypothetical protein